MKKTIYNYIVGNAIFTDSEPFGKAWREAKAEATKNHLPIYRTEVEICHTVYINAGCFISKDRAAEDDIKIF